MKKAFILFIMLAAVAVVCGCSNTDTLSNTITSVPEVTGEFKFSVLKVGQADAIIMQTQNHNIIIDCGEKDDGDDIVSQLDNIGISSIDYTLITHFDKDHVGGFPKICKSIKMNKIFVPDYQGSNTAYEKYLKTLKENNLSVTTLTKDISFTIDDCLFEISVPQKKSYKEGDNDFSLVISITHGDNTFLFAGDAESERLSEILSVFNYQHDFLKVPHHGRYNKISASFIATIKPAYAVITDSEKNPAEEQIVSLLEANNSIVYHTKDGDVFVSSNGKQITVRQ